MIANANGHSKVVELLIKEQTNPNSKDEDVKTATMIPNSKQFFLMMEHF